MEKQSVSPLAGRGARIMAREFPCPKCGYDLRASTGGRCPECGAFTALQHLSSSRIPWIHRKRRGRLRTYIATLWLLLRHPVTFSREMSIPQKRKAALHFHQLSVLLATLACLAIMVPLLVLINKAEPEASLWGDPMWSVPVNVLSDSWWGVLPLALGFWIGFRLLLAGYRWIGRLGMPPGFPRERAARLGFYMSGVILVETLLLGSAYAEAIVSDLISTHYPRAVSWCPLLFTVAAITGILGLISLWTYSLIFVINIGRWKIRRSIAMIFAPAVAFMVLVAAIFVAGWITGYLLIAFYALLS